MSGVFFLYPQQVISASGQQIVLNNAAITIDGYQVFSGFGSNEIVLVINITNAPSGTLPTLTFTLQEVDPANQTTAIGSPITSAALNGVGTTILTKKDGTTGTVKVSWHVGGTVNPTFTGVNVTVLQRIAGSDVKITDGTNTSAVKAASAPPVVADPSLVVSVSPNNSGINAVQTNGNFPEGTVVAGNINPVVAAGHDPTGHSSILNVDNTGNLKVVTQTVPSGSASTVAFGQANTGAAAGALTPLRATTYTEQFTNGQRSLKSSNINDTALGTGARKVLITYYDASMNGPFTETVTLNGTTAVATVNTNICFIESMIVTNVGSTAPTGANIGTISLYTDNAGLGTVIGSIGIGNVITAGSVGDNRTLWAHHYVAGGKTCSITTISGGTNGNQTGVVFLRYMNPLISDAARIQITGELVVAQTSSSIFRPSSVPLLVSGPAKITEYAVSNGANTVFFGGFQFFDS